MHRLPLIIAFISLGFLLAKANKNNYNVSWSTDNNRLLFAEESGVDDQNGLPYRVHSFSQEIMDITISEENAIVIDKTVVDSLLKDIDDSWVNCTKYNVCVKKSNRTEAMVWPIFRDKNGVWKKATSYSITTGASVKQKQTASTLKATESSVLANGKWVKVQIETTGIKRISKSTLETFGFTDISKIAIYGNGGKQLAYSNSATRQNDLARIAVRRANNNIYFFANGTDNWTYTKSEDFFSCTKHDYDTYAYYFITESDTPSEEIESIDLSGLNADEETSVYDYREHHELNTKSLISSGREWFGEEFNYITKSRTLSYNIPNLDTNSEIKMKLRAAGRSSSLSSLKFAVDETNVATTSFYTVTLSSSTDYYARAASTSSSFYALSDKFDIDITYSLPTNTSYAWLDYLTINAKAKIDISGKNQLDFRLGSTFYNSGTTKFNVSGASADTRVWIVTNISTPIAVTGKYADGIYSFNASNGSKSEFIAFNENTSVEEIKEKATVTNQDLHSLESANYIIVCPKEFLEQANALAQLHEEKQGISTIVVTTEQIYNEYSSGTRDASAIRDFVRSIYKKADEGDDNFLKYLLLFGDGSLNNITIDANTNPFNIIPTYQSAQSLNQSQTYVTDDFYGFLDDSEGASDLTGRVDIGVGRMPISTVAQAEAAVEKTKNYLTALTHGKWKSKVTFFADDGDSNEHVNYAELNASRVEADYPKMNVNRIYLDGYNVSYSASGKAYPDAKNDIESAISDGTLILNYVGHGSPNELTAEQVLTRQSVDAWTNKYKLFFFITATCEFTNFDEPAETSSGENVFLNTNGGGIGLFTSTRLVYGDRNYAINSKLYDKLLNTDENGQPYSYGEATRHAKVLAGGNVNSLKYILLCDPALCPPLAKYEIKTDSINGIEYDNVTEPIKPLTQSVISGSVRDADGDVLTDFNGDVAISLYDKKTFIKTNGNDSSPYTYKTYKDKLFTGNVDVVNGRFLANIILSKDASYDTNVGKILYYGLSDDNREAAGADETILVGGIPDGVLTDTIGPEIEAWINTTNFKNGQVVNNSPILYVTLNDESGINVSGAGVGHDITLIINDDRENAVTLNQYYESTSKYSFGKVTYQFPTLEEGKYELVIKAWDNISNSTSKRLNFVVKKNIGIAIEQCAIYPNPYNQGQDALKLSFQHNAPNESLNICIKAYSMNGQLMIKKYISTIASQNGITPILLSDEVDEIRTLPQGIYTFEITVDNGNGRSGKLAKKIVVVGQ